MLKFSALLLSLVFAAEPPIERSANSPIESGSRAEPPTITWFFTSVSPLLSKAPANIVDDKHPLFAMYVKGLADYQHPHFIGTIPRIEAELKSKKLVCYPGSSDASRRKEFSYLTPQYIQPGPQLITTKKVADDLLKRYKTGIPLREVLNDPHLKGMLDEARSFGAPIDKLLKAGPNNIKRGVFETFSPSLINMIEKNRADYTIEYPFILNILRETAHAGVDLVNLPLTDGGGSITQYLACSKTSAGLEVIKRADRLIRDHVKSPQYWSRVLESIPKKDRKSFQKEINKFIEGRIKGPVIIE